MKKIDDTQVKRTVTLKTLDRLKGIAKNQGAPFSVSYLATLSNINYYYAKIAVEELIKSNFLVRISTTRGELFQVKKDG